MALATILVNGVTNDVIAMPPPEVLTSDRALVFPLSLDPLLLIDPTFTSRPLVLTTSLKSIRGTLCHFCPGCMVDLRTTPHRHTCSFASDDELDFDPNAYLDGGF